MGRAFWGNEGISGQQMTMQCNGIQLQSTIQSIAKRGICELLVGSEVADECDKGRLSGHRKRVLRREVLRSTVTQCTASAAYSDLATSCSFHLLRATKNLIKDQGFESETFLHLLKVPASS